MTWADLIRSSLRLIGQLAPGRGPSGSEQTDALLALNSMLDAWRLEKLVVWNTPRTIYTLTPGQQTHTLGPGADWQAERPVRLEAAGIILDSTEAPLLIVRSPQEWALVGPKSMTAVPGVLYDDNGFPTRGLHFWPAPSQAWQVALYPWAQLSAEIDDLTSDVWFPPGYAEAVRYNLAVRLAPEWSRDIRPDVMALASDSLAAIKRQNMQMVSLAMSCDDGVLERCAYDIRTGR